MIHISFFVVTVLGLRLPGPHAMVETQRSAQVLDPRGAFKAPAFNGKRDEFESWAFQFESYVGLLGWTDFLAQVRELTTEVDELEMSEQTRQSR